MTEKRMPNETALEPGSLEWKMNKAVLRMNNKLKEQGFNERERAAMWGMTIDELQEFLTTIWESLNNDGHARQATIENALVDQQNSQIDQVHGPGAAAVLEAAIADGSVFSESSKDPEGKPKPTPKPPKPVQTNN